MPPNSGSLGSSATATMAATTPTLVSDFASSTERVGPEDVLRARLGVHTLEVGLERLAGGLEADHPDTGEHAGDHARQSDGRDGQQRGRPG